MVRSDQQVWALGTDSWELCMSSAASSRPPSDPQTSAMTEVAAGTEGVSRMRRILRGVGLQCLIILVTLVVAEVVLRIFNPRYLKDDHWVTIDYRHDADLGWSPVPNSSQHNSAGLRDIEFPRDARPTILVLGDSLVWGLNIGAKQRMTEIMRERMPGYRIVNAGMNGYGTDQEYLFLQRIWNTYQPAVVVVVFSCTTDRLDNTQNVRNFSYKPYFVTAPEGGLRLQGQPVPKPRRLHFRDTWLGQHLLIARVAISGYVELRYPRVSVPDPTERLTSALKDFVEAKGARLMFGVQAPDPALEASLQSQAIPYTRLDGTEEDSSKHWTPRGHAQVAERLLKLLSDSGIAVAAPSAPMTGAHP